MKTVEQTPQGKRHEENAIAKAKDKLLTAIRENKGVDEALAHAYERGWRAGWLAGHFGREES